MWLYLLLFRGSYWLSSVRDDTVSPAPSAKPHVGAVIPARNEADSIADSLGSLLAQDYAGRFSIILVDDNSEDATAAIAERLAREARKVPLTVLRGEPLPEGWTGKLWAVKQGIAEASKDAPDFLLLTDADIVYEPHVVSWLASHAVSGRYVLTSLMAKLRCESFAERAFIPAFIYFFQMLYPFRWVNNPHKTLAAAAGGCMLVKADALARAGGIEAIRDALIDDCTLGKVMKEQGPIWLGLTKPGAQHPPLGRHRVTSMPWCRARPMPSFAIRRCCWRLTILAMALTYWVAPLAVLFGDGTVRLLGLGTFALMAVTFWPTLRFYGLTGLWGLALPAIATAYMAFTLSSALQHMLGRGGRWKGRNQARMRQRRHETGIMSQSADYRSGKGHRDENFPVASHLVSARHRPIIMAFYDFARSADDIADHATLSQAEKFAQLDRLEASLTGTGSDDPVGLRLRAALMDRNLPPRHALDLLESVPAGRRPRPVTPVGTN